MNYRIVFSPDADADINSIVRWYQNIDPNLAVRFRMEIDTVQRRIKRIPHAFPIRTGGYRRARLNRFPYFIYYSVEMNIVIVDAVVHQRRSEGPRMGRGQWP